MITVFYLRKTFDTWLMVIQFTGAAQLFFWQNESIEMPSNFYMRWYTDMQHTTQCRFMLHLWSKTIPSWRHQVKTFCALLAICAGNSPVTGEFLGQRPPTRSFYVFFDIRLYKRLSKQSWGWWFETPSCSLWRHFKGKRVIKLHVPSESLAQRDDDTDHTQVIRPTEVTPINLWP